MTCADKGVAASQHVLTFALSCLQRLTETGITICATIHSPSPRTFELFERCANSAGDIDLDATLVLHMPRTLLNMRCQLLGTCCEPQGVYPAARPCRVLR